MGVHNKNLRIAVGFTLVAFILIFIAFVSPYWLVFDGKLKNPKFLNLGKWNLSIKCVSQKERLRQLHIN